MVHGGLAADATVNLCQQCSGNLDEGYAAQVGRSGKARQISNNPTSQGKHGRAPIEPQADKAVIDPFKPGKALRFLSVEHFKGLGDKSLCSETFHHPGTIGSANSGLCDYQRPLRQRQGCQQISDVI
jgi:hypothetical protein